MEQAGLFWRKADFYETQIFGEQEESFDADIRFSRCGAYVLYGFRHENAPGRRGVGKTGRIVLRLISSSVLFSFEEGVFRCRFLQACSFLSSFVSRGCFL